MLYRVKWAGWEVHGFYSWWIAVDVAAVVALAGIFIQPLRLQTEALRTEFDLRTVATAKAIEDVRQASTVAFVNIQTDERSLTMPNDTPTTPPGDANETAATPATDDLENLRLVIQREGELRDAFLQSAAFALDLTLTCLTTDRTPEEIRRRAYATHRKLLQYRDKYTLRSRGEVERGQRDIAIDAPNADAFGDPVAQTTTSTQETK